MNTIWPDEYKKAAKLRGKFADPSNATRMLKESTQVITPDGEIAAVFLRGVIPARLHLVAYELLKEVDKPVDNRPAAMGTLSLPQYVNADGSASPRGGVHRLVWEPSPARQGTLGWNRPGHLTALTQKHAEMLEGNRELIELADRLYAEHSPIFHAQQMAALEKIPWRLWQTSFTTFYALKNCATGYHRDGNLKGGMTAITPFGKFRGGALILLRWRIAIPYLPGDLLIFNAEELHGNLPFEGDRLSAAMYCGRWVSLN
jgi:hypothetical protein